MNAADAEEIYSKLRVHFGVASAMASAHEREWIEIMLEHDYDLFFRASELLINRHPTGFWPPKSLFNEALAEAREEMRQEYRQVQTLDESACATCEGQIWIHMGDDYGWKPCNQCNPTTYERWERGIYEHDSISNGYNNDERDVVYAKLPHDFNNNYLPSSEIKLWVRHIRDAHPGLSRDCELCKLEVKL